MLRREGALLCFKWRENEDTAMLSKVHEAVMVEIRKVDCNGNKKVKALNIATEWEGLI